LEQPLRLIKLTTGENIIGEILQDTPTLVIIKHPLRAMMIPKANGINLALLRWDFLFEFDSVSFNKSSIIAFGQVSNEIEEAYTESIHRYYNRQSEESDLDDEESYMDELEKAFSSLKSKSIH
jgi:hypothetical protein